MTTAQPVAATRDLEFIRSVVARTDRRIDPHAFHYVHWGAIVLLWYPLANWLASRGDLSGMSWVGIVAIAAGTLLSTVREMRLSKKPRLEGENTFIGRQLMWITFACVGAGVVLTIVATATGFIDGWNVPILWGLVYATMATMIGIVYRREFLYSGIAIFLASILAMIKPEWNGFILGPVMGLGMILPGLMAERRVQALGAERHGE